MNNIDPQLVTYAVYGGGALVALLLVALPWLLLWRRSSAGRENKKLKPDVIKLRGSINLATQKTKVECAKRKVYDTMRGKLQLRFDHINKTPLDRRDDDFILDASTVLNLLSGAERISNRGDWMTAVDVLNAVSRVLTFMEVNYAPADHDDLPSGDVDAAEGAATA